jgi:hypothetical protein
MSFKVCSVRANKHSVRDRSCMWILWVLGAKLLAGPFLQNLLAPLHNVTLHHGHLVTNDPSQR